MVEKSFTKKQKKYYEVCIVDLMDAYYSLFADSGENVDTDLSLFYLPDEDGFETMFITHDPQLNQKHLYLYFLHYAGQFKGDTSNAE